MNQEVVQTEFSKKKKKKKKNLVVRTGVCLFLSLLVFVFYHHYFASAEYEMGDCAQHLGSGEFIIISGDDLLQKGAYDYYRIRRGEISGLRQSILRGDLEGDRYKKRRCPWDVRKDP